MLRRFFRYGERRGRCEKIHFSNKIEKRGAFLQPRKPHRRQIKGCCLVRTPPLRISPLPQNPLPKHPSRPPINTSQTPSKPYNTTKSSLLFTVWEDSFTHRLPPPCFTIKPLNKKRDMPLLSVLKAS